MADRLTLEPFEGFVLHARTRFPFRYGIAEMTDVPHVFLRTRVSAAGRSSYGIAAEGLPPKWFTKDPATTFAQDLPVMLRVIRRAAAAAVEGARRPVAFFDLWRELQGGQDAWARRNGIAPLLAGLGVSLVERAVLDGLCRASGQPLHRLVAGDVLGLRLDEVRPGLPAGGRARLAPVPLDRCHLRHTVGLGDPLVPEDIPPGAAVADGLPQDLRSAIRACGLRYFKVKLTASADADLDRLARLAGLLDREAPDGYFLTLDGNENFADIEAFRAFWERVRAERPLERLAASTLAVEQPVHRGRALDASAASALKAWRDRPPLIIDESDGALDDLPRALEAGYDGTSHKNCKGIVKGLANAALLAARRAEGQPGVLTGEDLCTIGPVALLQDLAMMALLGISHVERNGHHYYRGLSMLPRSWQAEVLRRHGDLYREHEAGFPCLRVESGSLDLRSVNAAPFGTACLPDLEALEPLGME